MNPFVHDENIGDFNCEICRSEIPVLVRHADNLELDQTDIKEALASAANYHWYSSHYNCARCGKWIQPDERELIFATDQTGAIHPDYIPDKVARNLLRIHKTCLTLKTASK